MNRELEQARLRWEATPDDPAARSAYAEAIVARARTEVYMRPPKPEAVAGLGASLDALVEADASLTALRQELDLWLLELEPRGSFATGWRILERLRARAAACPDGSLDGWVLRGAIRLAQYLPVRSVPSSKLIAARLKEPERWTEKCRRELNDIIGACARLVSKEGRPAAAVFAPMVVSACRWLEPLERLPRSLAADLARLAFAALTTTVRLDADPSQEILSALQRLAQARAGEEAPTRAAVLGAGQYCDSEVIPADERKLDALASIRPVAVEPGPCQEEARSTFCFNAMRLCFMPALWEERSALKLLDELAELAGTEHSGLVDKAAYARVSSTGSARCCGWSGPS